ncbi:MAG: hypothetical protein ACI4UM_08045 [Succinivibrio sp.]
MTRKIVAVAVLSVLLTACTMTPEQCDPSISDPGMLDKLGCVVSGSYEKRVDSKKQEIHDLREEQRALTEQSLALSQSRSELIKDRKQRYRALDELNEKIADIEQSLAAKNALTKDLEAKIAKVKASSAKAKDLDEDVSVIEKKEQFEKVQNDMDSLLEAMASEY